MNDNLNPQDMPDSLLTRPRAMSRRRFLVTLSTLSAGSVLLVACGQQSGSTATATPVAPTAVPATNTALAPTATTVSATATTASTATTAATATEAATATATETATVTATAVASSNQAAVASANALLAVLDDSQRSAASFAFDDSEQLVRWSNFPTGIFQRDGIRMGDLSQEQQDAVYAVLEATLSPAGYEQARATVTADEVLKSSDGGGNLTFGQDEYWFAFLGTPSDTDPWRWQFGGHHLALNATFANDDVTLAPSLTGAQPARYTLNGLEVRPLGVEDDAAFALIGMLDETQLSEAVIGSTYIDLALGPGMDGIALQPEGILASELNAEQQAALLTLIQARVGLINETAATKRMADIQANLGETYFAWSGPTTEGSAAYYRVQGPTVIIEYSPQGMGGDATNHIHAMFRDPTNEYGASWVS